MPVGLLNPEINAGFTVAPEVVYSPIVPVFWFVTNRLEPDSAMPQGLINPEISAGCSASSHRRIVTRRPRSTSLGRNVCNPSPMRCERSPAQ